MDRRTLLTAMLGTAAASVWTPPEANALGLPRDKIKRIRYYKTPTDAAGRPNIHQPTFNQSTNIVTIETESGLVGIGEGGEPSTMEQCAGLLIVPVTFSSSECDENCLIRIGHFAVTVAPDQLGSPEGSDDQNLMSAKSID